MVSSILPKDRRKNKKIYTFSGPKKYALKPKSAIGLSLMLVYFLVRAFQYTESLLLPWW